MPSNRVQTRAPRPLAGAPPAAVDTAPDDVAPFLEDAAHYPGGRASGVIHPRDEAQLADALRRHPSVLAVGAQSSLTGGATPRGELVISLAKLTSIEASTTHLTAQPGVTLAEVRAALAGTGRSYPPAPTFEGATVGGVVSTNAAGAATFKYGPTRRWVRGLSVMLASGELVDLERGQVRASNGRFEIATSAGSVVVNVPTYRTPVVPKCSAGYHAAPDMDLVDLFIGSEGTLGVLTSVTFDLLPIAPQVALVLIGLTGEAQALAVTTALRAASIHTRDSGDPHGLDVAAIEHLDRRCLELVREDGADRRTGVSMPDAVEVVLLAQLELPGGLTPAQLHTEVGLSMSATPPDTPVVRLCRLLHSEGLLDSTELVAPADSTRIAELLAFREAVPEAVNRRVGIAKRTVDATIEKTAADMIVPYDRFGESLELFRRAFESRGLDYAIWGHISDANLHPNLIPTSAGDVRLAREAILECGREVIRMGGSPLAEHGVGRNPTKQRLLAELYGNQGIEEMRAVKRALDPEGKLAPGVLFPASRSAQEEARP